MDHSLDSRQVFWDLYYCVVYSLDIKPGWTLTISLPLIELHVIIWVHVGLSTNINTGGFFLLIRIQ